MTLSLNVNNNLWTSHLKSVLNTYSINNSEVTPVIKGNGYGIGKENLAKKSKELGIQTVAVGTVFEAKSVLDQGISQVLIMDPVKDIDELAFKELSILNPSSLLLTISCLKDAQNVGKTPVVIEGITSMNRFGIGINELSQISDLNIKALSLHLPIENPSKGKVNEISDWINAYQKQCPNGDKVIFLSHVSESELKTLTAKYPEYKFKLRIGTKLWIGD